MSDQKNPWLQKNNIIFNILQQFGEEIGINISQTNVNCNYSFIERLQVADEEARKARQCERNEVLSRLNESPGSQFLSSTKLNRLMDMVQSLQEYYDKYNNIEFINNLAREVEERNENNNFLYMSPENRASFYATLNLALKLSDKKYMNDFVECQRSEEIHVRNSVEAAKSLLGDLYTMNELIANITKLHADFMGHVQS